MPSELVRTQVQLSSNQSRRLRALAAERHVSVAELIRESVDNFLAQGGDNRELTIQRALDAAGRFHSGLPDVAQRHDEYLAEDLSPDRQ